MNKSEAGKLGRAAVLLKYSEETRRMWSKKGALKLNEILSEEDRRKGGFAQDKSSKSLGARNAAKKKQLSPSESLVISYLQTLGFSLSLEPGSDFEIHSIIKTSIRPFEVDLAKFENGIPKIIVEVTSQKSEIKGESIAFKASKIKKDFPDLKFVAIVPKNTVSAGLIALKSECDEVIFIEELSGQEFFSPIPQGVDAAVQLDSTPGNSPAETAV